MRSNRWLVLGATLVAVGCSPDAPGALVTKYDSGLADTAKDAPVQVDAGDGDASVDSAVDDGGDGSDGSAPVVWQCSPSATWINPQNVGVSGKGVFGAITADETTLAWLTNKTLHWVDRKSANDPWGNESTTFVSTVASAHLAISASGLRIVLVVSSGKNMGELTRASKADAFAGPPDTTLYQPIAFAISEAPIGSRVDDPVLAEDEAHLLFTLDLPNATSTMRESSLGDGGTTWGLGTPLSQVELAPQAGALRRPTGMSSDRLTLFYWDEVDTAEHAAFRTSDAVDFSVFAGLGTKPGAQVDGTCMRLYYGLPAAFEYVTRQ